MAVWSVIAAPGLAWLRAPSRWLSWQKTESPLAASKASVWCKRERRQAGPNDASWSAVHSCENTAIYKRLKLAPLLADTAPLPPSRARAARSPRARRGPCRGACPRRRASYVAVGGEGMPAPPCIFHHRFNVYRECTRVVKVTPPPTATASLGAAPRWRGRRGR